MRSVMLIAFGLVFSASALGDEESARAALMSRLESEYTASSVLGEDSPIVSMMLAQARKANPSTDDTTWNQIRKEVAESITAMLTEKDGMLDVLLREALNPLSTSELRRLEAIFSDPAYRKFRAGVTNADTQKRMMKALMENSLQMTGTVNKVLEQHGLITVH